MSSQPARPRRSHNRTTSFASIASITSLDPKAVKQFALPLTVLLLIVLASAAQTEIAHYLTTNVDYHQPYFTFYLTHITFALVFPLHLGILLLFRKRSASYYINGIRHTIAHQLGDSGDSWRKLTPRWTIKITWLTLLISIPALCWFIAVNLTSGLSVTTIYATSAFWAYLFSMILLKQPLSKVTVGSIALAFAGVIVLSLDGLKEGEGGQPSKGAPNPLLGDIIMMIGAMVLGLYEVVYKMALPEGQGGVSSDDELDGYASLPIHHHDVDIDIDRSNPTPPESRADTPPLDDRPGPDRYPSILRASEDRHPSSLPKIDRKTSRTPLLRIKTPPSPPLSYSQTPPSGSPTQTSPMTSTFSISHEPPKLPPALHSNFITSCIGVVTIILLWLPMPPLHWTGWETFRWPGSEGGNALQIWAGLEMVAWGGAVYNAGLMILIGIWGPTTSSVANLLAIGLVAVIEAVWVGEVPSAPTLSGVGMICVGFGILLWEGEE